MVTPTSLHGARVFVLEDDYYQATDLQRALEAAGATVVGPFGDVTDAQEALADAELDCAFVDVNLGQGPSFAIPLALAMRSVPFAFITGYDAGTIPGRLADVPRFDKPIDPGKLVELAGRWFRGG